MKSLRHRGMERNVRPATKGQIPSQARAWYIFVMALEEQQGSRTDPVRPVESAYIPCV